MSSIHARVRAKLKRGAAEPAGAPGLLVQLNFRCKSAMNKHIGFLIIAVLVVIGAVTYSRSS
jgi:hypothetical protein